MGYLFSSHQFRPQFMTEVPCGLILLFWYEVERWEGTLLPESKDTNLGSIIV